MRPLESIIGFLGRRSKTFIVISSFFFIAALGAAGYFVGLNISSSLFYLIPILALTWFADRWWGALASVLSSANLFLVEWFSGRLAGAGTFVVLWNEIAPLVIFLVFVAILSSLKGALAREEWLSRTDPLTGLLNRRYFGELVASELERARRYGHPVSLAYLDLDNFKAVNDSYGHDAGNRLLVMVAELFKENLRASDEVARLGGDEFAIMLTETGPEASMQVVMLFKQALLDAARDKGWPISASIGLVTFLEPPAGMQEMLKEADSLMYQVKSGGKDDIRQEVIGGQRKID